MDLFLRSLALSTVRPFWASNQTINSTASTPPVSTPSLIQSDLPGIAEAAARNNETASITAHGLTSSNTTIPGFLRNATGPAFANRTATPLSHNATSANATECFQSYWSYTEASRAWTRAHKSTSTTTISEVYTVRSIVPTSPRFSNYSIQCDGLPRFGSEEEAAAAFAPIALPSPVVTTSIYTMLLPVYPEYNESRPAACTIKDAKECSGIWKAYGTSRSQSLKTWSSSNVLTISLASPPTKVTVNDKVTLLPSGTAPTLTLHGTAYQPISGSYSITGAISLLGEPVITPGGRGIFTWNGDDLNQIAYGPTGNNCNKPSGNVISSQCATAECTIAAQHVELLYFPPPITSRDLCANTSPGFNRYSVTIFSQSHASTIINSTTFWSDKAYLRYSSLSAYKKCSEDNLFDYTTVQVGNIYSSHYVEVASSDVSSICSWRRNPGLQVEFIGATAYPANFDDFNGPIPASAYQCIPECFGKCSSIISSNWIPGLAVPSEVRRLDPAWASCVPYFLGVPDPPIALATRSFLTTAIFSPQPTLAAPGVTLTPPTKQTQTPDKNAGPADPMTSGPVSTNFPNPPDPAGQPQGQPQSQPQSQPQGQPQGQPNGPGVDPQNPQIPPLGSNPPVTVPFTRTIPIIGDPSTGDPSAPLITVGGVPVNIVPSHPEIVVVGTPGSPGAVTVHPGETAVLGAGTTISVAPSNGGLIVSGQSALFPVGVVGGQTVWIDPSRPGMVMVGDPTGPLKTVTANGNIATISGTTISLALPTISSPGPLTIHGIDFKLTTDSRLIVDGKQTLKPGDPQISYQGHSIFFSPDSKVTVDGVEYILSATQGSPSPAPTNIKGLTFSYIGDSRLVIDGKYTLNPGDPQLSINGHTVVYPAVGVVLVDGEEYKLDPKALYPGGYIVLAHDGTTSTIPIGDPSAVAMAKIIASMAAAGVFSAPNTSLPGPGGVTGTTETSPETATSQTTNPQQTGSGISSHVKPTSYAPMNDPRSLLACIVAAAMVHLSSGAF